MLGTLIRFGSTRRLNLLPRLELLEDTEDEEGFKRALCMSEYATGFSASAEFGKMGVSDEIEKTLSSDEPEVSQGEDVATEFLR